MFINTKSVKSGELVKGLGGRKRRKASTIQLLGDISLFSSTLIKFLRTTQARMALLSPAAPLHTSSLNTFSTEYKTDLGSY